MSIYEYKVKDAKGNLVSLEQYRGKVLLIVNTATGCGFTPQYGGLEKLYEEFHGRGLEILDFPCNQFAGQAPGTIEEITSFCQLKYHTSFPQLAKIKVNGKEEDPLYNFLKKAQKGDTGARISWNFTKFLVNRNGEVVKRFAPPVKPEDFAKDIKELL